ncbi:MAG: TOBE domain-containing protein, partial [Beijerinckiaceae bacterium]
PGQARLGVRPDAVHLSSDRRLNALPGKIVHAAYLGKHMEYTVATDLFEFFVVDKRVKQTFAVDAPIWLTLDPTEMTVLPA